MLAENQGYTKFNKNKLYKETFKEIEKKNPIYLRNKIEIEELRINYM